MYSGWIWVTENAANKELQDNCLCTKPHNLGCTHSEPLANARLSFLPGGILPWIYWNMVTLNVFLKELGYIVEKAHARFVTWAFLCYHSLPSPFPLHVKYKLALLCKTYFFFYLRKGIIIGSDSMHAYAPSSHKRIETTEYHGKHIFKTLSNVLNCNIMFSPPAWLSIIVLTEKMHSLLWSSLLKCVWKVKTTCCHLEV